MKKSFRIFLKKYSKQALFVLVLSLPVVLFVLPFVVHKNGVMLGDWDYFAQLYEAARRSIVEFNQFPWWNPWVAGGVPLYANPQFGLVSIQMPLVIVFGTLTGLKLAVLAYLLLGFWGMRMLLIRLAAQPLIATLLSYIFVFSGFGAWHFYAGHLTFSTYFLAPWFIYFLLNIRKSYGWLYVGVCTALILNLSVHYITIHILLIGGIIAVYQIVYAHKKGKLTPKELMQPYIFGGILALILSLHKLLYTLQYLSDYSRVTPEESANSFNIIIAALTFRGSSVIDSTALSKGAFGWWEYAAYFSVISLLLFGYIVIKDLHKPRVINHKNILLLILILFTLLLAFGSFSSFSPYALLKQLPVFEEMRVASRWLGWVVFGILLYLAKLPKNRLIVCLLIIACIDVFLSNYGVINRTTANYNSPQKITSSFEQYANYQNQPVLKKDSLRFYSATQANVGDIYGYEPIFNFNGEKEVENSYEDKTNRCGLNLDKTCTFVLSGNAVVREWSPNKIVLERTGEGNIQLNMNPGNYWLANGERIFTSLRVTELKSDFIITQPEQTITLTTSPSLR